MHIALIAKQIQFSHALQFYHFNRIERFLLVLASRSEVKCGSFWSSLPPFLCVSVLAFLFIFFSVIYHTRKGTQKSIRLMRTSEITEISVIKSERGDDMVQGPGRTDEKQKEPQNGTDKT